MSEIQASQKQQQQTSSSVNAGSSAGKSAGRRRKNAQASKTLNLESNLASSTPFVESNSNPDGNTGQPNHLTAAQRARQLARIAGITELTTANGQEEKVTEKPSTSSVDGHQSSKQNGQKRKPNRHQPKQTVDDLDDLDEKAKETIKEAEHFVDVIQHFLYYGIHTNKRLDRIQRDWARIDPNLKALVPGLEEKWSECRKAISKNQEFIRKIVSCKENFMDPSVNYEIIQKKRAPISEERMSKVRSTLRSCLRDWSKEGQAERDSCFGLITKELESYYPTVESRAGVRVLVPGSGLSRLTWDIAKMGFDSQGNIDFMT
jgi:hypothetical protein